MTGFELEERISQKIGVEITFFINNGMMLIN